MYKYNCIERFYLVFSKKKVGERYLSLGDFFLKRYNNDIVVVRER